MGRGDSPRNAPLPEAGSDSLPSRARSPRSGGRPPQRARSAVSADPRRGRGWVPGARLGLPVLHPGRPALGGARRRRVRRSALPCDRAGEVRPRVPGRARPAGGGGARLSRRRRGPRRLARARRRSPPGRGGAHGRRARAHGAVGDPRRAGERHGPRAGARGGAAAATEARAGPPGPRRCGLPPSPARTPSRCDPRDRARRLPGAGPRPRARPTASTARRPHRRGAESSG